MELKEINFNCVCGCHLITLSRFEDDEDVSIVFWEQPFYSLQPSYKIVSYFKRLWSAILGKEWLLYSIILSKDDANRLAEGISFVYKSKEDEGNK